jgi:DNA-binding transcriptional ArsR family regulator
MGSQLDSTTPSPDLRPARIFRSTALRATVTITDSGHLYTADQTTGEILHATRKLPLRRIERKIEVYVGSDTKFPSQARDSDELFAAIIPFDNWLDKQYFSPAKAIELLGAGASGAAVRTLDYLAQNLAGRNYWFGRIEDLTKALDTPKRTVERALKDLESMGVVKRKTQGRSWPTRITVHPWYAWRGDLLWRDSAYSEWLNLSSAEFGG